MIHPAPPRKDSHQPKGSDRLVRSFALRPTTRRYVELQQRHPGLSLHEELDHVDCVYASHGQAVLQETEETVRCPATAAFLTKGLIAVTRPVNLFHDYFGGQNQEVVLMPEEEFNESEGDGSSDHIDGDIVDEQGALAQPAAREQHHFMASKRPRDAASALPSNDPAAVAAIAFNDVCTSLPRKQNVHDAADCFALALTLRSAATFDDGCDPSEEGGEVFVLSLREILDPDFLRGIQGGSVDEDQFHYEESQRQARLASFRELRRLRRGTRPSDVIDLVGVHTLPGRRITTDETLFLQSSEPSDELSRQQLAFDIAHDVLQSLFAMDLSLSPDVSFSPLVKLSYHRTRSDGSRQPYTTHVYMMHGMLDFSLGGCPTHLILNDDSGKTARVFLVEFTPISEKLRSARVVAYYLCPRSQFEAALTVEYLREVFRQAVIRRLTRASSQAIQHMRLVDEHNQLVRDAESVYATESAFLSSSERRQMKQQIIDSIRAVTSHTRFSPLFPAGSDVAQRKAAAADFDELRAESDVVEAPAELRRCIVALRKHYGFRKYPIPLPLLEGLVCAIGVSVVRARSVTDLILRVCDSTQVGAE